MTSQQIGIALVVAGVAAFLYAAHLALRENDTAEARMNDAFGSLLVAGGACVFLATAVIIALM